MLGDELLERRRLASADLLDQVVRAGKDTVLVIDGDFPQMLDEEGIPGATLELLLELAEKAPGGMLGGRLLAARIGIDGADTRGGARNKGSALQL